MGRKKNIDKKREVLTELLKVKESNLKRSVYLNYLDDITFYANTINKLNKIQNELSLIPSRAHKIKRSDIKKLIKNNRENQSEIRSILNAGQEYSTDLANIPRIKRSSNMLDKYRNKTYAGINYFFREYVYDDEIKLNIVDGLIIKPNVSFIGNG